MALEQIIHFDGDKIESYTLSGFNEGEKVALLSAGSSCYICDEWSVKVARSQQKGIQFIEVYRLDEERRSRSDHHAFKLRDGVLQIKYGDGMRPLVKFHTAQLSLASLETFGITNFVIGDPNIHQTCTWNPQGKATGTVAITWLATDGRHCVSGYDGKASDTCGRLRNACGEVRHIVTKASWTVVCRLVKNDTEMLREITLYTEETNRFLMSRLLGDFLENSDKLARFEDIVEPFLVE